MVRSAHLRNKMTYVEFGKGMNVQQILDNINARPDEIILFEKARFLIDKVTTQTNGKVKA